MYQFLLGTSLASFIGYAKALKEKWHNVLAVHVGKTKHGDYIIHSFIEAGIPRTKEVTFTQNTKQEMAKILKQCMAQRPLVIPYDRSLLDELNTQRDQLTKAGRIALDHPPETHDDQLWAHAAKQPPPPPNRKITPIKNTTPDCP